MSNIIKYKKPELAILQDEMKIRDHELPDAMGKAADIVTHLILDLGVSGKADPRMHQRSLLFIVEAMKNYTFGEIKKAFQMFIAGELREKPLQQLNSVIIGRVMSQYQGVKAEKLRIYNLKMNNEKSKTEVPSPEEILEGINNRITELFLEYSASKDITGPVSYIYDHLYKAGSLPAHNKEYRDATMVKAKALSIKYEAEKAMKDASAARSLGQVTRAINEGKHDSLKAICKRVALKDYFQRKIDEASKEEIKD